MSIKKTFFFYNHQNKQKALVEALQAAGWQSTQPHRADVVFVDTDFGNMKSSLRGHVRRNQKLFIYPHAARPNLFNDLPSGEPFPDITAQFVAADGHREVLESYGYSKPIEVIGWHLCPIKEFEAKAGVKNVLFAPIHPNVDGSMSSMYKELNATVFDKLVALMDDGKINLTVRHVRSQAQNRLHAVWGVTYIEGKPDQTITEIDAADIVVSAQTFLYLAVARGVPALSMDNAVRPHSGCNERANLQYVKSWEKYREILEFPLDINSTADVWALMNRAVNSDVDVLDWRRQMIGKPFDARAFVAKVEKYL